MTSPDRSETSAAAAGPAAPPAEDGLPFERIGEFRLLRMLGAGGMGVVYLAEQTSLGRQVALKVIRPEYSRLAVAKGRFQREAAAVAKLAHPNIVAVHSAGEERGLDYLAMDHVPGRGLDEILGRARSEGRTLDVRESLRIAAQIARALECAHAAGILHRDVKPSNVRIHEDGRAMLLDFGLARGRESAALTRSGEFQGSPYYAAPEQVRGRFDDMDGRTDVFSLGTTLYECLTGVVPFGGDSVEAVLHNVVATPAPPPRETNAALPRDVETVVLKALEKDPGRRYAGAREFAEDLEALLALRPIRARPPGPLRRAREALRQHPLAAALGVAVLLAAGAVAVTQLLEERRQRRQEATLLAEAGAARAGGRLEEARDGYAKLLLFAPDHPAALRGRAETERLVRDRQARAALDEADTRLEEHRASLLRLRELQVVLEPLRAARGLRYLDPDEVVTLERGEIDLAGREHEAEELAQELRAAVASARALEAPAAECDARLADLHMERWRLALARDDRRAMAAEEQRVAALDAAGRHAEEVQGLGRLTLVATPSDAEVHLYRYVDQSELLPNGERRLVLVPVRPFTPPRPYGAWLLRVVHGAGDMAAGDLVLGVAGRPVRDTLLVAADAGEVRALDRLLAIDGVKVRDPFDVDYLESIASRDDPGPRTFRFERRDAEGASNAFDLELVSLAAAGIDVRSPAALVERGGVPVEVFHDGEKRALVAPPGLTVRATGAPLFACAATRAAAADLDDAELAPGSYLALVRAPGHAEQRVPFVVPRGGEARLDVALLPADSHAAATAALESFVHVPAGAFPAAGDPAVETYETRHEVHLDDFWMQEHEVTFAEYVAFLNDPDTRTKLSSGAPPPLLPRIYGDVHDTILPQTEDGAFEVPHGHERFPIYGVSFEDALAYAAWKTRQAEDAGLPLVFDLPTSHEWEKAARGVDGRRLVCGNHFVANWMKSFHARPVADVEPVLSFPVDESPYGVYDLGGSLNEWCSDRLDEAPELRVVRGGAWNQPRREAFHAAYQHRVLAPTAAASIGFRLVARRRG